MEKTKRKLTFQKPFLFSFFLFALSLAIGAFLINEVAFFNDGFPMDWMNDSEYYSTFAAFLLVSGAYIAFAVKRFQFRPSYFIVGVLALFTFCGTIGIFLFPEVSVLPRDILYVLTMPERWRCLISFFVSIILLFLCFDVAPKTLRGNYIATFYCIGFILIVIASIIFSWVNEFDKSYAYLFHEVEGQEFSDPESFFNNRNTFAFWLLSGMFSCAYLNSQRPRYVYALLMLCFYSQLAFSRAKFSLIVGFLFLATYWLTRAIRTWKYHPIRNLIAAILTAAAIAVFVCSLTTPLTPENCAWRRLFKHIYEEFMGFGSFRTRLEHWTLVIGAMKTPVQWIFGIGYRNINHYLGAYYHPGETGAIFWTHNGYVDVLGRNGIIGAILEVAMIVYVYVAYFKLIRSHKTRIGLTGLYAFTGYLMNALTETTDVLLMDGKSTVVFFIALLPVLYYRQKEKETKTSHTVVRKSKATKSMKPYSPYLALMVCFFLAYIFAAIGFLVGRINDISLLSSIPINIAPLLILLAVPPSVFFYKMAKGKFIQIYFALCVVVGTSSIILIFCLPSGILGYVELSLIGFLAVTLVAGLLLGGFAKHPFFKKYGAYMLGLLICLITVHIVDVFDDFEYSKYEILVFSLIGLDYAILFEAVLFAGEENALLNPSWNAIEGFLDRGCKKISARGNADVAWLFIKSKKRKAFKKEHGKKYRKVFRENYLGKS